MWTHFHRQISASRKPLSLDSHRLAFELESLERRQLLAGVVVSNALDAVNAGDLSTIETLVNDDGGDGISLREAILATNNTAGADTITFHSSHFGAQQMISISSQLPTITDALTITGSGASLLTLNAGNGSDNSFATGDGHRIFNIDDSTATEIVVALSGMTLTGGDAAGGASGVNGASGGAIQNSEHLTLTDVVVTANAAGSGGAEADGGDGGGVFSTGTLTITRSVVSGNMAGSGGDGIHGSDTFTPGQYGGTGGQGGNGGRGGGVFSQGALNIAHSSITNNASGRGGRGGDGGYSRHRTGGAAGSGGSSGSGGGVFGESDVTISSSSIVGNTTGNAGAGGHGGGGDYRGGHGARGGDSGGGGGVYGAGVLGIADSTIGGNLTGLGGRGGNGGFGEDYISGSAGQGGSGGVGGGVFSQTDLMISRSTLDSNTAGAAGDGGNGGSGRYGGNGGHGGYGARGSGIFAGGTATLENTTVSGNSSGGSGIGGSGGLSFDNFNPRPGSNGGGGPLGGGAVFSIDGTVVISSSTVTNNVAHGLGGGVRMSNSFSQLQINNSIVAGNMQTDLASDISYSGTLTLGFSLIGTNAGNSLTESQTPNANNNLIGTTTGGRIIDPRLAPLANNGGPTPTHALQADSLARDAGDPALNTALDQRGRGRARPDIGAFETQAAEVIDGSLIVTGTRNRDKVRIRLQGNQIRTQTQLNVGTPDQTNEIGLFNSASVQRIIIQLGGERDLAIVAGNLSTEALIDGGAGNDRLLGGGGSNTLLGQDGDDFLRGGRGSDIILGGTGNDRLLGLGGSDVLSGMAGSDTLNGGAGNVSDILIGGADADTLVGAAGNDLLVGHQLSTESDAAALQAHRSEWLTSTTVLPPSFGQLIADGTQDRLLGGAGDDWIESEPIDFVRS